MKIAYTINGLIGGLSGKNFQLKDQEIAPLIIKYTGNTVNKFIKANNDVDFFIFSWQPELKEHFDSVYNPKLSRYMNQDTFNVPSYIPNDIRTQAHYSRWFGVKVLSEMIRDSNTTYDLIINCRMDTCWNNNIHFNKFEQDRIHVAYHKTHLHYLPFNKDGNIMCDHIFIANSENFHTIATLFDSLNEYAHPKVHRCGYSHISNHFLLPQHIKATKLVDKLQGSVINILDDGSGKGDYDIFRYRNVTKNQLESYEL